MTRQLKNRSPNGLKIIDDLALKQNTYRLSLVFFGVRCFNSLNVQFHSSSFILRRPSITLWRNNVFIVFQKIFFCSAIIFVGLVESCETSESGSSTFCVMNIHKKPQAAMPLTFNIEGGPISPFHRAPSALPGSNNETHHRNVCSNSKIFHQCRDVP